MIDIRLTELSRHYGRTVALDRLTLDIAGGGVTALLGPSGCGKTTALKLVAGLLDPTAGRVRFADRDVTDVPAERRGAVMVFQDHRLFPYLSAADNVAFGLRMRGVGRRKRRRTAEEALERVGLAGLADRRPAELSGGQQQRVALARALVLDPDVLLLDEPLASLDAHLRDGMRQLLLDVHLERQLTTIVVTHDQEEAVVLADEIALLFEGRLEQHGAPRTFFEHPGTERTARFFGNPNLVPGFRAGSFVETPLGRLRVRGRTDREAEGRVLLVIRPERIRVCPPSSDDAIAATVVSSAFLGTRTRAVVEVAGLRLAVDAADDALADVGPGAVIGLAFPSDALWTVRSATGSGGVSPTALWSDPAGDGAGGEGRYGSTGEAG